MARSLAYHSRLCLTDSVKKSPLFTRCSSASQTDRQTTDGKAISIAERELRTLPHKSSDSCAPSFL